VRNFIVSKARKETEDFLNQAEESLKEAAANLKASGMKTPSREETPSSEQNPTQEKAKP
jgi:beta-lactam-binding protein with PASTA domain